MHTVLGDVHESVSVPVNLGLRKNNTNLLSISFGFKVSIPDTVVNL